VESFKGARRNLQAPAGQRKIRSAHIGRVRPPEFRYVSEFVCHRRQPGSLRPADGRACACVFLSAAKRLRKYHELLSEGNFEQWTSYTKKVAGSTLGIIGYGSIGKEVARLMEPFSVRVIALNTTGKTDHDVHFVERLRTWTDYRAIQISLSFQFL